MTIRSSRQASHTSGVVDEEKETDYLKRGIQMESKIKRGRAEASLWRGLLGNLLTRGKLVLNSAVPNSFANNELAYKTNRFRPCVPTSRN